jgi:hypothetical protein
VACHALSLDEADAGKRVLHRIVSMLTRMTDRAPHVREDDGIEYEYRCAEHEHER